MIERINYSGLDHWEQRAAGAWSTHSTHFASVGNYAGSCHAENGALPCRFFATLRFAAHLLERAAARVCLRPLGSGTPN